MLRPLTCVLVLVLVLAAPLAGALPSVATDCQDQLATAAQKGCMLAASQADEDNDAGCSHRGPLVGGATGCALSLNISVRASEASLPGGMDRVACSSTDQGGTTKGSCSATRNHTGFFDISYRAARNATVPPGDPDFDLLVCCGDLDGDGDADVGAWSAKNGTGVAIKPIRCELQRGAAQPACSAGDAVAIPPIRR